MSLDPVADAQYQAKLAARAAGTKTVVFQNPPGPGSVAISPADAQYQAKLAARKAVPTPKSDEEEAKAPDGKTSPEPDGDASRRAQDGKPRR